MILQSLNLFFKISDVTLLTLVVIMLLKYAKAVRHVWAGVGFVLCIISYLWADDVDIFHLSLVDLLLVTGAMMVPMFFWLLAKAVFDDHFKFQSHFVLFALLQTIPNLISIYRITHELVWFEHSKLLFRLFAQMISVGFLLAGLFVAIKTEKDDLLNTRLQFRRGFIVVTAFLIGVTLIVEIAVDPVFESPRFLQLLQRFSIFILTGYFLATNLALKPGFFFKETPKLKTNTFENHELEMKLESQLREHKIYRMEGLTIRELAEILNEQEYQLRKLINGKWGFRNFNDFLNQYRVVEASEILSDPSQNKKTILEIAFQLGYQSIGPFNRAFKEAKGVTPTAFRKDAQNRS